MGVAKPVKKPAQKKKRKASESESEAEIDEEESEDDEYMPVVEKVKAKKTPPKKPARKSKVNHTEASKKKSTNKRDPVFFKDEFLAVRTDEGSFYLCKAMQNIYIGSR